MKKISIDGILTANKDDGTEVVFASAGGKLYEFAGKEEVEDKKLKSLPLFSYIMYLHFEEENKKRIYKGEVYDDGFMETELNGRYLRVPAGLSKAEWLAYRKMKM